MSSTSSNTKSSSQPAKKKGPTDAEKLAAIRRAVALSLEPRATVSMLAALFTKANGGATWDEFNGGTSFTLRAYMIQQKKLFDFNMHCNYQGTKEDPSAGLLEHPNYAPDLY